MEENKNLVLKRTTSKAFKSEEHTLGRRPTVLKSNGLGKYKLPRVDDVPASWYVAKVTDIREGVTSKGMKAIEVYFIMKDANKIVEKLRNMLPSDNKLKTYYIKQVYTLGNEHYEKFVYSMNEMIKDAVYEDESYKKNSSVNDSEELTVRVEDILNIEYILISLDYNDIKEPGGVVIHRQFYEEDYYGLSEECEEEYAEESDYEHDE